MTIALNAVAIFVMFTVLHDASHYSISSRRWVNGAFGRAAMLFVSPLISFPAFGFIHIEHHRHTNDDEHDPDHFASHGPWWQLPVRFAAMDAPYLAFYVRNLRRRPRAEVAETAALMALSRRGDRDDADHRQLLAVGWSIYLIPERIAMIVLAWWFDWLPHHGLEDTQSENRYRATRNRVGLEWLFTPLMLSQNYHLVHHLHPSVPFYRYLQDVAAQRGGLPRARRRDLDRVRQVAQPRRVPRVEAAQPQAAARCCRCGCRPGRAPRTPSFTACRSRRSTRSPPTARWSPSRCPRSCATSSGSSPAST